MRKSNFPRTFKYIIVLPRLRDDNSSSVMLSKPIAMAAATLAPLSTIVAAGAAGSCESSQVGLQDLESATNNSYFVKWRPSFHCQAPNSWQNGTLSCFKANK